MNLLIVSFFLTFVASLVTCESIDCVQCFTSTCGPCATDCGTNYCSSECTSCLPKCVECMVKNCEASLVIHNSPFAHYKPTYCKFIVVLQTPINHLCYKNDDCHGPDNWECSGCSDPDAVSWKYPGASSCQKWYVCTYFCCAVHEHSV